MLWSWFVKVLHVTSGYYPESPGGIETYLEMTTAAQQAAGLEVCVLSGSLEIVAECGVEEGPYRGIRVLRLRRQDWYHDHYARSYHPCASELIRELFEREWPDLVHVHQWLRLSSDVVAIANALGIATVVTLHDVYTSCPRAFRVHRDGQACQRELSVANCSDCVPRFATEPPAELAAGIELFRDQYCSELAMADRVLVAMQVTADLLARSTGLPRERYEVHDLPYRPRFADLAPAAAAAAPVRFAYWGSLTAHKGPQVLLEAMRLVVEQSRVPVELHLFGPLVPEALAEDLRGRAAGLPVVLHGAFGAEDLAAAGLHVGVFPVLCFEAFGLALAECFELGLPAIVSDIGALAERIGEAGLRVPVGDAVALAAAMVGLAQDPGRRSALAGRIVNRAPTPADHAVTLSAIYREAIAAPRRPAVPVAAARRAELLLMQRESLAAALRQVSGRRDPM